jgi:hypothetical protein
VVHAKPACGLGLLIKAPRRHMRLEGDREGREEGLKLGQEQAGDIQKR